MTSSLTEQKQVILFPLRIPAEQNIQAPWQMAATVFPLSYMAFTKPTNLLSLRQ